MASCGDGTATRYRPSQTPLAYEVVALQICDGPSVQFDAVAMLLDQRHQSAHDYAGQGSRQERIRPVALIAIGAEAQAIFTAAGIADYFDEACLPLGKDVDPAAFFPALRAARSSTVSRP